MKINKFILTILLLILSYNKATFSKIETVTLLTKIEDNKKNQVANSDENLCAVCYSTEANRQLLPCRHSFCSKCVSKIQGWSLFVKCPFCRGKAQGYSENGKLHLFKF